MTAQPATRRGLDPARAAAYRRVAGGYAADPIGYAGDVLGAVLTPQQAAVPAALLAPPRRLLMPSANAVGKTFALGWLANWHHDSFDPGMVLATSATFRQVRTQLFKEVRRLRPFGLDLLPRAPEVHHHERHAVYGFATNRPDSFQGQHEGAFLILMDEATGVPAEFAERAETMFKGIAGHGWVCTYNPNDPTTWPYAAEQSGAWAVQRLSALEHPNILAELRGEPPPVPGAVRLDRVLERIGRECDDCGHTPADGAFEFPAGSGYWHKPVRPEFNPQVRGRWPEQATNAIWGQEDRRRCEPAAAIDPDWPVQIGCDVARFGGDRFVFAVRKGVALVHLEAHTHWPTRAVSRHAADRLRELCEEYAPPGVPPKLVPCAVDDSGGYGSGVTDYPEGYSFVGVSSSQSALDPGRYPNKRSELWFLTRLAADQGGFLTGSCGPGRDLVDQLWQELTAARYTLDRKGRRVAEGKDAVKERLRRSPDLADGVNLAWYPVAI